MKKFTSILLSTISLILATSSFASEARVTLNWTVRPPNENVITYIVSEQLVPGRTVIGHYGGPPVVINNVANGAHNYIISGFNAFGEGIPSQTVTVNIFNYPIASPGIPANVTASVFYTFP